MAKIFIEVFREQVPIAVRLEDITEYVKRAREMNCDEMRIIVSYDPANPGIELIFGRLAIKGKDFNSLMKRLPNLSKDSRKNGFCKWISSIPCRGSLKDNMSQRDWVREYLCMPALPCMSFHEFINIVAQSFKHLNLRDKDLLGGLDPQNYEKFIDEIRKGPSASLVAICRKFGLEWKN